MMVSQGLLPICLAAAVAFAAGAGAAQAAPLRPLGQLLVEARTAAPPRWPGTRLGPDLVDIAQLDPSLRFDIRYATSSNFLGAPVYGQARAFLQRPVAEALVRANAALRKAGFLLRIHDAYRPWWVTKAFWEATPAKDRAYVADPAKGSVHNRGCAVDLDLVRAADGVVAAMPSEYDEFSPRSHADYAGASAEATRHRELLRAAMEAEGFAVEKEEWWHFNHATSADYPIMNVAFEAIQGQPPELAQAGQLLLVTAADWNSPQGRLQRFERRAGALVAVGTPLPVWLGRTGLAWRADAGSPPPPGPGPVKREGDGKSPAGLLTFGEMRGYAPKAPEGVRLAYRDATECDRCVDDPDHPDYGRIVRLGSPTSAVSWRSAEHLRLATEHYRYLLVIHYNDLRPIKAAGSCIFLHVAPPPGGGTAGCTALAAADLLAVLRWLDPARRPLLLQLPEPVLDAVRAAWNLPLELRPPLRPTP